MSPLSSGSGRGHYPKSRSGGILRSDEHLFRLTKGRWVPYGSRRGHEPVTITAAYERSFRAEQAEIATPEVPGRCSTWKCVLRSRD